MCIVLTKPAFAHEMYTFLFTKKCIRFFTNFSQENNVKNTPFFIRDDHNLQDLALLPNSESNRDMPLPWQSPFALLWVTITENECKI